MMTLLLLVIDMHRWYRRGGTHDRDATNVVPHMWAAIVHCAPAWDNIKLSKISINEFARWQQI